MFTKFRTLAAGALLIGSAFVAPAIVMADDDDDELGAYLYEVSCDALNTDAIIEDLGDLEVDDDGDDNEWMRLGDGQDAPSRLWVEDEDIDRVSLDDLLASPHAIAIHASDSKKADVIACGDIIGNPENGSLLIEIQEVSTSGFEGRAFFAPENGDDDNELEVTVGAWAAGEVEPLTSPAASTPAG